MLGLNFDGLVFVGLEQTGCQKQPNLDAWNIKGWDLQHSEISIDVVFPHVTLPCPLICKPRAIPLRRVIVVGCLMVPRKSFGSGEIEMLAPESQIMGIVFACGPRDDRMRAGACRAMPRIVAHERWTWDMILCAALHWLVVHGEGKNELEEAAAGTGKYLGLRRGFLKCRSEQFFCLPSPFWPVPAETET
jgi:hypothetical protein